MHIRDPTTTDRTRTTYRRSRRRVSSFSADGTMSSLIRLIQSHLDVSLDVSLWRVLACPGKVED